MASPRSVCTPQITSTEGPLQSRCMIHAGQLGIRRIRTQTFASLRQNPVLG